MVRNPFRNFQVIKDPENFFGRKDEIDRIFSLIEGKQPESVSIIAERKLGKSSLLYQIYSRYKKTLENPDDYLFYYHDLQQGAYSSPGRFCEKVMEKANGHHSQPIDYNLFEEALQEIRFVNNKRLVLLLDEFDSLVKNEKFDSAFLENLRALPPEYDLCYLIASQRPLNDICHQKVIGSPFFNIFHRIDLSVFKRDEAEEMLLTLSERGGRGFSEETIKAILAYVGYHPFLIQLLAHYVFEMGGNFELAVEGFLSEAKAHLEYYLNHLTDKERAVIEDLNKGIPQFNAQLKEHLKINKEEINRLRNSGWLIEKDEGYQLVPVFAEGRIQLKNAKIKSEIPKDMPKTDPKQSINIINSQNVTIAQAGGDAYYTEQKEIKETIHQPTQLPQQTLHLEKEKPPLAALVLLSSPFIKYRANKPPILISKLEIDKEKDLLDEKLKKKNAGIFVDFVPATAHILLEKLMDDRDDSYKILHFIGHGTDEGKGELYFEDNYGAAHIISPEELKGLLKGKDIWLLVLNACHSEKIAEELNKLGIRVIICVDRSKKILDKAAITFSAFFYAGLSAGMKVIDAFNKAKTGVAVDPDITTEAKLHAAKYKIIPEEGGNFKLIDIASTASYASSVIENKTINLPSLPLTFVGREEEIVKVNKALLDSKPVITLKGLPGVGKTTLAIKVAYWHKGHPHFNAGIIFVDCTKQSSHHRLLEEIGRGIFADAYDSIDEKMREKMVIEKLNEGRYLVILDNFEDVQEKDLTGHFLTEIKKASRMLITSREQVGLSGFEEIIEVGLLPIKAGIDLFKNHAEGIGCKIEDADLPVVSEIVTVLEGLPLAVELSARQLGGAYNLKTLLADLKEKMTEILKDKTSLGEEKNKSLTASFELSYTRLSDEAKELFKRFSIFRGETDMEMVSNVCEIKDTHEAIGELIRKSLMEKKESTFNSPLKNGVRGLFFYMLASLRDYGQRLLSEEERRYYHQRAANYFASLPLPERGKRHSKKDILPLLEAHYHACQAKNYHQAYQVIFDTGLDEDLVVWGESATLLELCKQILGESLHKKEKHRLLGAIGRAYWNLCRFREAIEYYKQALKIAKEIGDRQGEGRWLGGLGETSHNLCQYNTAIEYYKQALKIAKNIGDRRNEGRWLGNLGLDCCHLGQYDKAIEYYKQALGIAKEIGDKRNEGWWLGNLGDTYHKLEEYDKAIEYYKQALEIAEGIGDRRGEGWWLGNLGDTYRQLGQYNKAIKYSKQALEIAEKIGDRRGKGWWLGNLGGVYDNLGQFDKAIGYYQQGLDIAREIGDRLAEGYWLNNLGEVYAKQANYDLALDYFQKSEKIRKEIKDPKLKETQDAINKLVAAGLVPAIP